VMLCVPAVAEVAMAGLPRAVTLAHHAVVMVGGLPGVSLQVE